MTEEEAQAWLKDTLRVPRETFERLDAFRAMVIEAGSKQNLVSAASIPHFWARHIVDSAQLVPHAPSVGDWLDLGTGAGFPGVVVAILRDQPMTLVESRRKRADFLIESVQRLGLNHASVFGGRLETMPSARFGVISARAFAPLPKLFALAQSFSKTDTVWLLPKGRSAREEVESVRGMWQGSFHVKQSVTDSDAAIIIATQVARRERGKKG